MAFLAVEIIKKKRNGLPLTKEEIDFFVQGFSRNEIPDYQMSALMMSIYFQNMSDEETLHLTHSVIKSGSEVTFPSSRFKVDKHSTGGVGDKTSLILGPIVAALGIPVPMIAGRGLGHTGGTLDKLESIPGFNGEISLNDFVSRVEKNNLCLIGQTKEICPADKKMYALRDVTATIESYPLICASIMSKKLAEGIDGLVLDVKFGSGAFMKTLAQAEGLSLKLMAIAKGAGKKVATVLSSMDQPLGRFAGNSLEIHECLEIMKGSRDFEDTRELSLKLAALMLQLAGVEKTELACHAIAEKTLMSGEALKKFEELCKSQSGDLSKLPTPKNKIDVFVNTPGYIQSMNTEKIGVIGVKIKAGRAIATDVIEPTAGIEFHKKIGDRVDSKTPVFSLYGADKALLLENQQDLLSSITIAEEKLTASPLIAKTLW